jgi:PAS domain S-box-containing protein
METLIQHQYEELFNCLPDGAIVIDSKAKIMLANQAAASILGYTNPQEMKGIDISTLYSNPSDHDTLLSVLGHRGVMEKGIYDWKQKNGQPVLIELRAAPLRDSQGHITGIQGIFRDITKKLESQLAQQQTLEETAARSIDKNQLIEMINFYLTNPPNLILQGIAHNLNTPLGNIRGRAELIKHNIEKHTHTGANEISDKEKEFYQKQIKGIGDIITQVDKTVDIIKSFTNKITFESDQNNIETDINSTINNMIVYFESSLYFKHRIQKEITLDTGLPMGLINTRELNSSLYHIIVNCIKATAGLPSMMIRVQSYVQDQNIIIEFSDNRNHMDEAEIEYHMNVNASTRYKIPEEANFSAYDIEILCAKNILEANQCALEIISGDHTLFRMVIPQKKS